MKALFGPTSKVFEERHQGQFSMNDGLSQRNGIAIVEA